MEDTRRIQFSLNIPSDEFEAYYTGDIRSILTRTTTGKTVRFPASILRKFLTHKGIYGSFEMALDKNNKFMSIERIGQKQNEDGIWL
ncbi:MAG: DUF2835 domain-containing protein [Candidatus Brocadiaceae bacterium]|nr:DUF2835 domain-containing protein [Candidatus Brocadiaceae bacterium]